MGIGNIAKKTTVGFFLLLVFVNLYKTDNILLHVVLEPVVMILIFAFIDWIFSNSPKKQEKQQQQKVVTIRSNSKQVNSVIMNITILLLFLSNQAALLYLLFDRNTSDNKFALALTALLVLFFSFIILVSTGKIPYERKER